MALRLRLLLASLILLLGACTAAPLAPSPSALPSTAPSATTNSPPAAAVAFPLALTDDAGRRVSLSAAPRRIVSLAPSNTEIACALDACDRLVGVTDFDDFPAAVTSLPKVVVQAVPDVEKIVAQRPDLVLAAGNQQTPQPVIDRLTALGTPVLVLYPRDLDGVYADIDLAGRALDSGAEAAALVGSMRSRVEAVRDAVAGRSRPRVFYEVSFYQGTIYTAAKDSFLQSLITLAGGSPIVGDATGVIDPEQLITADPQLILLGDAAYDPSVTAAAVASRTGWEPLAAVRARRVLPMREDEVITRPGPRIVDGLEALAKAIHPEAFG